jgi:hypothetical protein
MKKYQITYPRLLNTEFYQFLFQIRQSANEANPVISKFKPEYDILDAIMVRLLAAIDRDKASELTKEVEKLDARRDFAFSGFMLWLQGYAKYPLLPKREAAITMLNYIETHGKGIVELNFQAESSVLSKIVDDCKKETKLITALATLNDNEWLIEIESANTAFMNTYNQRSAQIGENQNKETFFDVRNEAIPAYEELVDMINSRYKTAVADKIDTSLLQKCMNQIDATLTQYRQLIIATQASKKTDKPPVPPVVNK